MTPHIFKTSHARFDAIICDIDGCLSSESAEVFDLAALAEIARHNHGAALNHDRPMLTLCTGRPQPFAEAMTRLVGNLTLPLVAENGVWLYFPANNRYERDPAITPEHRAAIVLAAKWLDDTFAPLGVSQQPGKSCSVSLYHEDPSFLREISTTIQSRFRAERWPMRVSMTWRYINCDLAHVSKATGITRILEHIGIPKHRLAGIGDTMSDMAIRESVGFFACPANAADELKPHADYVSSHEEAAGVVDILKVLTA